MAFSYYEHKFSVLVARKIISSVNTRILNSSTSRLIIILYSPLPISARRTNPHFLNCDVRGSANTT